MGSLFEQLVQYKEEDYYPMHMPGHKRNTGLVKNFAPYEIDITEIDGFDNLHHAEGIIRDLTKKVELLYSSKNSFLLINGSTVGILAGISAAVNKGDRILMARNCHKAVYNAVILNELQPQYIYPQMDGCYGIHGGISPEKIKEMLITYPDTKLVVLTSPTYEGIISNIEEIVRICHAKNIPVLIDEAHGAHLGFDSSFEKNSVSYGADIVIHSIHKTLPAFTQTAIMHVNGDRIKKNRVEQFLGIYETSSPSYLLLAGIDQCMTLLENSEQLFHDYKEKLEEFYHSMEGLKSLKVMRASDYDMTDRKEHGIYAIDPSKIVISVKNTNITGKELANRLLHEYKIQLEMSSMTYALAMTSICDTKQGFERLKNALLEIDATLTQVTKEEFHHQESLCCKMRPYDAIHMESERIEIKDAKGRIASENIIIYPPGIPVVVAGEVYDQRVIQSIDEALKGKLEVLGVVQNQDEFEQQKKEAYYVAVIKE